MLAPPAQLTSHPPFIITVIMAVIVSPAVVELLLPYLKGLARNGIVHEDTFAKPDCGKLPSSQQNRGINYL